MGDEVEEACNEEEGLERYRRKSTDRVIAMTGGCETIGVTNFLDVAKMRGARQTLQKPVELKILLETVAAEVMS